MYVCVSDSLEECKRCGDRIDKSACGQAFSIITIKNDRDNNSRTKTQKRYYLCDGCTASLELFLMGIEYLDKSRVGNSKLTI